MSTLLRLLSRRVVALSAVAVALSAPAGAALPAQSRRALLSTGRVGPAVLDVLASGKLVQGEQVARFEQAFAGPGGGGPGGVAAGGMRDAAAAGMRRGQVWVLDDGEPRAVRVLVGLSDGQYTEVVSDDLKEGDEVIVRLAR